MTLIYTGSYNAPNPGLLRVQNINNGVLTSQGAMPAKFYPSAFGSLFSNNRMAYIKDAGGGGGSQGVHDASERTALLRINAIGKSSTKVGLPSNAPLSFKSNDNTIRNTALQRCRSGGCVAPKKKGAIANPFKSGGSNTYSGTPGNRVILAP